MTNLLLSTLDSANLLLIAGATMAGAVRDDDCHVRFTAHHCSSSPLVPTVKTVKTTEDISQLISH